MFQVYGVFVVVCGLLLLLFQVITLPRAIGIEHLDRRGARAFRGPAFGAVRHLYRSDASSQVGCDRVRVWLVDLWDLVNRRVPSERAVSMESAAPPICCCADCRECRHDSAMARVESATGVAVARSTRLSRGSVDDGLDVL